MPLLKRSTLLLLSLVLAACQVGSTSHPVPTVSQIGSELKCAAGDHPTEDSQAGWGFCYPGTWKYNERQGASTSPPGGLDITFDIVNVPCASPPPGTTPSAAPSCSPDAGLFAFMIVSTFERGSSTSIADWVKTNLNPQPKLQPITWGNAVEAAVVSCTACPPALPNGSRIALTAHHIVILDLHSAQGNLDLEAAMAPRLDTWRFLF